MGLFDFMNYLNIHTDTLKSVEFIGAGPVERATWICLLGWCATQENGGVIEDCSEWPDRKWQQLCGVLKSEVETISELYGFQDRNLVVEFYPIESELAVKAKRAAGKKGGRPRKETAETKQQEGNKPYGYHNGKPSGVSELKRKERKGKEKEGKEMKRNEIPPIEDVIAYMQTTMPELLHDEWTPERVRKATTLKYETCVEAGWKDGNHNPIVAWKTKFRNMMKYEKPWNYSDKNAKPFARPQSPRIL